MSARDSLINQQKIILEYASPVQILGKTKYISAAQATLAWKQKWPDKNIDMRYYLDTFRKAAEENLSGTADWRLVYIFPLSLKELRKINSSFFYDRQTWYFSVDESNWVTKRPEAGYYLIDLRGRFGSLDWEAQENAIANLGSKFKRASETIIAQAVITVFFSNNEEHLLPHWYHWGNYSTIDKRKVVVGMFTDKVLSVDSAYPKVPGIKHMTCIVRGFDF